MSLYKNNTIFPEFIKIELAKDLVNKINTIVEEHKSNVKDAVIYSLKENTTMKSDRRVSHKASFHSDELNKIVSHYICPLIYGMLKNEYPSSLYDVEVGMQISSYIKYDNGGYFDKHKDFIRINNSMQQQYTLLIGLTNDNNNCSGNTVLWIPVDDYNIDDYNVLLDSSDDKYNEVIKKYNMPYLKENCKILIDSMKEIKCIPYRINCFTQGRSLLFRSDIIHSGEEFYSFYNKKELCMLTINITGINNNDRITQDTNIIENPLNNDMVENTKAKINNWIDDKYSKIILFDSFESFMCKIVEYYDLIPFQIIISKGEYNHKKFSDLYIKYFNLQDKDNININNININNNILENVNSTLIDIYTKTKEKLNTRGRETHISMEVVETKTDTSIEYLNKIQFNTKNIDSIDYIEIDNYVNNFIKLNSIVNNNIITHTEKVNNVWEESTCNDDGDEYDETTYLNCSIDIKWCFIKNSKIKK